jgi:L-rhamnose mutarotase
MVQRMGRIIGIDPEGIERYKDLHANPWPETLAGLKARHIHNFSIFLREPENLLFAYWEYSGTDFEADLARTKDDPKTRKWWNLVSPLQRPLSSKAPDDWWSPMEQIFFAP